MNRIRISSVIFGLMTVLISTSINSQEIFPIGSTHWSGYRCILAENDYLYCGSLSGMMIMDISDNTSPSPLSRIYINGGIYQIATVNNFAFAHNYSSQFKIFDVSDKCNPYQIGTYSVSTQVRRFYIQNQYAYLRTSSSVEIVDISNPGNPHLVGSYGPLSNTFNSSIFVLNQYIYVGDGNFLKILDASNIANPVFITSIQLPGMNVAIHTEGQFLYAGWTYSDEYIQILGIKIYDISTINNPIFLGEYTENSFWRDAIILDGNYLYFASESPSGLRILDISNPSSPQLTGTYGGPWIRGISKDGSFVYLATDRYGPYIIDVSNPGNPILTGTYEIEAGDPFRIFIENNYAYVSTIGGPSGGHYFFQIIDIENPYYPEVISNIEIPWIGYGIYVSGSYAYIVEGEYGLQIIDVSTPEDPYSIGFIDTPDLALDVAVSGGYAYVADFDSGLQVIDIDPNGGMGIIGNVWTGAAAGGVAVIDDFAFVTEGSAYIRVVNIHTPSFPFLTSSFTYGNNPDVLLVRVFGDLAVASLADKIWILDISFPIRPSFLSSYPAYWSRGRASIYGNIVAVLEHDYLSVLDISSPSNPTLIGEHSFSPGGSHFYDVFCNNNIVMSAGIYALAIYNVQLTEISENHIPLPSSVKLNPNYPNPFNATTTVKYALPDAGPVKIEIYDLLGRMVETLVDEEKQAGRHQVVWDASGYSSGVYFYRIETGDFTDTKKMILLR